jgi:hypothetical protein
MASRNITLSISEDLIRRAKVLAAQRSTSVSALVSELLEQLSGATPDYAEQWAAEELRMREGIGLRVGAVGWSRAELHQR